jgi:hypothetical protein
MEERKENLSFKITKETKEGNITIGYTPVNEIPPKAQVGRNPFYMALLRKFLEDKNTKKAKIYCEGISPRKVATLLFCALKHLKKQNPNIKIKVYKRNGEVYIEKIEEC